MCEFCLPFSVRIIVHTTFIADYYDENAYYILLYKIYRQTIDCIVICGNRFKNCSRNKKMVFDTIYIMKIHTRILL